MTKAVSSITASVIIIAFTVSVSLMILTFFSSFSEETTKNISLQTLSAIDCSSAVIKIYSIFLSNETATAVVVNEGGIDLNSRVAFVSSNGTIYTSDVVNVSNAGSQEISAPANMSCTNFGSALLTTGCSGVGHTISSKEKVSFMGTPCTACDSIASGMLMGLLMDEGAGTTTYDSTNNNNDATCYDNMEIIDCTWTAGKQGYGISFDGIKEYVNVSSSASLNSNLITIEAWVKSSSDGYVITREPID